MKISVITVCYNTEDTIEDTIRSVLWQHHHDIEYIIVDGGSTDGTLDIVRKYEHDIAIIISEPDEGIYDAMNKGVLRCSGAIVNFMNADDRYLSPDVLPRVDEVFATDDELMVVMGDCLLDRDGAHELMRHPENPSSYDMLRGRFNQQSVFYRREAIVDIVGLFDTSLSIYADYEWMMRAIQVHRIPYRHIPIVVCMFSGDGVSSSSENKLLRYKERTEVRRRYMSYFSRHQILYYQMREVLRKINLRRRERNYAMPIRLKTLLGQPIDQAPRS